MIIKIFKISTKEMYTFKNKYELHSFIKANTNTYPSLSMTIDQLVHCLPVDNYYRVA